jgi:hypothetical protein
MGSQLTTLTPSDIQRFERDGYLVVRQAFSRADALAMEERWWQELEDTHGICPDDRSSWRQIIGDLKAAKRPAARRCAVRPAVSRPPGGAPGGPFTTFPALSPVLVSSCGFCPVPSHGKW